ncbi:MAG TPA: YtxH domain-containing protein [Candidatus Acidoferrales bacterium]|nr:YtxH domain-containing protein [Candidatus Acidoferrales bacterium]
MAQDDREVVPSKDDQLISTLAWFLTGAAIGVAAAILYAPKSGKETRQYISGKAQAGREAVENAGQDIAEASRDMFERGRKLVEDAADLFERGRKLVKG